MKLPLWEYREREQAKKEWSHNPTLNNAKRLMWAYYSRSREGWHKPSRHPPFDQYAAALLAQPHFQQRLGKDVYHQLAREYPPNPA